MKVKEDIQEVRKRKAMVYRVVTKFLEEIVEDDNSDLELSTSVDLKKTVKVGYVETEPVEDSIHITVKKLRLPEVIEGN